MPIKDKIILVTGSTRGIGLEIALTFARERAQVIVHGPADDDELHRAWEHVGAAGANAVMIPCDLADSAAIRRMFAQIEKQYNGLDVLVNNAVFQKEAGFLQIQEQEWDHVMAVNLKAPFLCSQLAAEMLIRRGGGRIINIGSVHEMHCRRFYAPYSVSKSGLLMLTKSMALELAEYNIQVNQVTPGAIATDLTGPQRQEKLLSAIPLGRVGTKQEVASMVRYLASDEAGYVTGSEFLVDGGLTLGFCASRPDL